MTPWAVTSQTLLFHSIFQPRILEWVPFPIPGDLPDPGIEHESLVSPALARGFVTTAPLFYWETNKAFKRQWTWNERSELEF